MNKLFFVSLISVMLFCCKIQSQTMTNSAAEIEPGRSIVISLDDLPMADDTLSPSMLRINTKKILSALSRHHAVGIGFVNAKKIKKSGPGLELLKMWVKAGMELGNHTFSHLDLSETDLKTYEDDILRGEPVIKKLMKSDKLFFRYPFNHTGLTKEIKQDLEEFLASHGYTIAPFTIEHGDYIFNSVYNNAKAAKDKILAEKIRQEYLKFLDDIFPYFEQVSKKYLGYEPPQIFLIHASWINADCLDEMLDKMEKRGYKFVSMEQALSDKAYQTKDNYTGKYGISWLHRWTLSLGIKMDRKGELDPPKFIMDLYEAGN